MVDYCVCINANCGLIIDSVISYPFVLVTDIFKKLDRDKATKSQFAEMKHLEVRPKTKISGKQRNFRSKVAK